MKHTAPRSFLLWSGLIAAAVGLGLVAVASGGADSFLPWALIGWSLMALIGVAGGFWIASVHGRPGAGFIVALGTCMLARLVLAVGGAVILALVGTDSIWPYVAGLFAGYLPVQVFEMVWFSRRAKALAGDGGVERGAQQDAAPTERALPARR